MKSPTPLKTIRITLKEKHLTWTTFTPICQHAPFIHCKYVPVEHTWSRVAGTTMEEVLAYCSTSQVECLFREAIWYPILSLLLVTRTVSSLYKMIVERLCKRCLSQNQFWCSPLPKGLNWKRTCIARVLQHVVVNVLVLVVAILVS